jgi:hypothetical protein
MRYSSDKDFNHHIKRLVKQGWLFKKRRKHNQIVAPSGQSVTFSKTPSDHRAFKNFINDIRHVKEGYA